VSRFLHKRSKVAAVAAKVEIVEAGASAAVLRNVIPVKAETRALGVETRRFQVPRRTKKSTMGTKTAATKNMIRACLLTLPYHPRHC